MPRQLSNVNVLWLAGPLFGLILSITLIVLAQVRVVRAEMHNIATRSTPVLAAATEMEISLMGTALSLRTYLAHLDPISRRNIEKHKDGFVRAQAQYAQLVKTPEEQTAAKTLLSDFDLYGKTAQNVLQNKDDKVLKVKKLLVALDALNGALKDVRGAQSQATTAENAGTHAFQMQQAIVSMTIATDIMVKCLIDSFVNPEATGGEQRQAQMMLREAQADFQRSLSLYRKLPGSPEENRLSLGVEQRFSQVVHLVNEIIALNKGIMDALEQNLQISRRMNTSLDENVRKQGEETLAAARAHILRTAKGSEIACIGLLMVGFFTSIVGMVLITKKERAVQRASANFFLIVEAAPNGMIMVGREGKITLVNS